MIEKHTWAGGIHNFTAQQHGPLLYGPDDCPAVILAGSYGALVNAELLRLAQRVQELEKQVAAEVADLGRAAQRVNELEAELQGERGRVVGIVRRFVSDAWESAQVEGHVMNPGEYARNFGVYPNHESAADSAAVVESLQQTIDDQEAMIRRNEVAAAGMLSRIGALEWQVSTQAAEIRGSRDRLAAEETRGRQYCLEIAEKAERIRELEHARDCEIAAGRRAAEKAQHFQEQLAGEIMAHQGTKMAMEAITADRDSHQRLAIRLQAAIEDGIGHIEQGLLRLAPDRDKTIGGNRLIAAEQLELAHEVLSKAMAGESERIATDSKPTNTSLAGDALVIEKRRHERTGSLPPHFYACGPVRETFHEAIEDANRLNGWLKWTENNK